MKVLGRAVQGFSSRRPAFQGLPLIPACLRDSAVCHISPALCLVPPLPLCCLRPAHLLRSPRLSALGLPLEKQGEPWTGRDQCCLISGLFINSCNSSALPRNLVITFSSSLSEIFILLVGNIKRTSIFQVFECDELIPSLRQFLGSRCSHPYFSAGERGAQVGDTASPTHALELGHTVFQTQRASVQVPHSGTPTLSLGTLSTTWNVVGAECQVIFFLKM